MAYTVYGATTQISYQDGAQENKGFEAEIVANPINGLNISMGYSYNDALLTAGDPDFVGHRPESAGPQNLANLWASYKFSGKLTVWFGLWRKPRQRKQDHEPHQGRRVHLARLHHDQCIGFLRIRELPTHHQSKQHHQQAGLRRLVNHPPACAQKRIGEFLYKF
jgi:hypothetical protein